MSTDAALRALAEPRRREILQLVRDEPRSVGEIAARMAVTPQAVSQHLRVLQDAGLVEGTREATRHLFVVRPEGFEPVRSFLEDFWGDRLRQLKAASERSTRARRRDRG
jgi:DNA-binding transcriptional ArsR family regulator